MKRETEIQSNFIPYLFPILLGISVITIAILGWIAYDNNRAADQVIQKGKKVADTIYLLNDIERLALDLETGGRGFVITGDERFLEPYESATVNLAKAMPQLERSLLGESVPLDRYRELEDVINAKVAQTAENIAVRRTSGLEAAVALVSLGEGRVFMEQVRKEISEIRGILVDSRTEVLTQLTLRISSNNWLMPTLAVIGSLAILLAMIFVYIESSRRYEAERLIIEANEMLENRVAERTRELNDVNAELKNLLDERGVLLESEKESRNEAEVANRLRDEFMAALSHELRNPLNSILGWARILKRGDLDDDVIAKAVDAIISSSETQSNIIDDLLDIGRIVSGKFRFDMRPINPSDLVYGAVESFSPLASAKEISIKVYIDEGIDGLVLNGDLNRLRQALWNLLSNALKFSENGSEIEVRVHDVGDGVEFKVIDHGMGIRPDFLPFIFDRFRQDVPPRTLSSGLGLGLPIVRAITEIHGGEVKALSEGQGKGSVFTIFLPLGSQAA